MRIQLINIFLVFFCRPSSFSFLWSSFLLLHYLLCTYTITPLPLLSSYSSSFPSPFSFSSLHSQSLLFLMSLLLLSLFVARVLHTTIHSPPLLPLTLLCFRGGESRATKNYIRFYNALIKARLDLHSISTAPHQSTSRRGASDRW